MRNICLSVITTLAFTSSVMAHSWYPLACCSDKDCWEVGPEDVTATSSGWRIESSGEIVPYDDPRIRPTPPEGGQEFHVCHLAGDPKGRILCLFVPVLGS